MTSESALPNLIVIGAQKCGTSALHYYLGFHPAIAMSRPKELNFFIRKRNWKLGREWYEQHFDPSARVRGESSPNYTSYPRHGGVPRRMHSLVPDARLIYLVRDPIERVLSQYVHNYTKRVRGRDLAAMVMKPGSSYIPRSRYYEQLEQFREHYDDSQILVLAQDDLLHGRAETLRCVFAFLGVDESFTHANYSRIRHRSSEKDQETAIGRLGERLPPQLRSRLERRGRTTKPVERPRLDPGLRQLLVDALHDDAQRLRAYTGRAFSEWSV